MPVHQNDQSFAVRRFPLPSLFFLRLCIAMVSLMALNACYKSESSLFATDQKAQKRFGPGFEVAPEVHWSELNGTHWTWRGATGRYYRDGSEDSLAIQRLTKGWIVEAHCPSCNVSSYNYFYLRESEKNRFRIYAGYAAKLQEFMSHLENKVRRGTGEGFDDPFYEHLRDHMKIEDGQNKTIAWFDDLFAVSLAFEFPVLEGFGWTLGPATTIGSYVDVYPDRR